MASEGATDSAAKGEEDGTGLKQQVAVQDDVKSSVQESSGQVRDEMKAPLTNGPGKGDGGFESGTVPIENTKLAAIDAPEKRGQSLSRQNSERGGNGENGITVEGKTGETKQEIQVSCVSSSIS